VACPAPVSLVAAGAAETAIRVLAGLPLDGALVVDAHTSNRIQVPVISADLNGWAGQDDEISPDGETDRNDVDGLSVLTSPPSVTPWWPWSPAPGLLPQGPLASSMSGNHVNAARDQAGAGMGAFLDAVRAAWPPGPEQLARAAGVGVRDALADLVAQVAVATTRARARWHGYHGTLGARQRRVVGRLQTPVTLELADRTPIPVHVARARYRRHVAVGCAESPQKAADQAVRGIWATELSRRSGLGPCDLGGAASAATMAAHDGRALLAAVTGAAPTSAVGARPAVRTALGRLVGDVCVAPVGAPLGRARVVVAIATRP
jgi:hypothetical protein